MDWVRRILVALAIFSFHMINYDDKDGTLFGFRYWLSIFAYVYASLVLLVFYAITFVPFALLFRGFDWRMFGLFALFLAMAGGLTFRWWHYTKIIKRRTAAYKALRNHQ